MPANMQAWLDGYNDQMEYLSRHPEAAGRKVTEARGTALKDVMATLPKGVYIVRCGDKSLTVTR